MKKLNEQVLKKLILETIEEDLLTEGKKKKRIKEVEPVPQPTPVDTSGDRPQSGMNNPDFDMSDEEAQKMSAPSVNIETLTQQFQDAVQAAMEAKQSGDQMKIVAAEASVKYVLDQVKSITGDSKK